MNIVWGFVVILSVFSNIPSSLFEKRKKKRFIYFLIEGGGDLNGLIKKTLVNFNHTQLQFGSGEPFIQENILH